MRVHGKMRVAISLVSILAIISCGVYIDSEEDVYAKKKYDEQEFYEEVREIVNSNWNENYANEIEFTVGQTEVNVDGVSIKASNKKHAKTTKKNKTYMISAKTFTQVTGGTYTLDKKKGVVTVTDGDATVRFTTKSKNAYSEGEKFTLSEMAEVKNEDVLIPVDALTDGLGYDMTSNSKSVSLQKEYQTKRLIVTTKNKRLNGSNYGAVKTLEGNNNVYILQFDTSSDTEEAYEKLSANKYIKAVEEDRYLHIYSQNSELMGQANDHLSWGVDRIHADEFIENMTEAQKESKVVVAVVDTGIAQHSYLTNRVIKGRSFIGNESTVDYNGHGTHVAGIIADTTMNTNVQIMPVQVLDQNGQGTNLTVALGIKWATENHADIVNLSLGGMDYSESHYLDTIINEAVNAGVTVVAAAGNEATDCRYVCPAHIPNVICVSAVDSGDNIAYFSNYGDNVSVAAPGVSITSTYLNSTYQSLNGTSMATPFVSASAALIKQMNKSAGPAKIKSLIRSASDDRGTIGWDPYYGAGVLNLENIDWDTLISYPTPTYPTPTPMPTYPTPTPTYPTPTPTYPAPMPTYPTPTPTYPTPIPTYPTPMPTYPTPIPTYPTPMPTYPTPTPTYPTPIPFPTISPQPPVVEPVPMYGFSVSVTSKSINGNSSVEFRIATKANIADVTIKIDGKDYHNAVTGSNGVYYIKLNGLSQGGHSYYISYGGSVTSGRF